MSASPSAVLAELPNPLQDNTIHTASVAHAAAAANGKAAPVLPGYDLAEENVRLGELNAEQRVAWALEQFAPHILLSSSFGAQSAVSLHLVTAQWPDIPVLLVDTGYLFPETYRFIDELTDRLKLNLKVYGPKQSPAWLESRHGKLWEGGLEGIEKYNAIHKVEPMKRGMQELGARAWIAGLRRDQASSRKKLGVLGAQDGRAKVHPIVDWNDRQIYDYLTKHGLPYHPLWEEGYVSIGDVHTTRRLTDGMTEEETRFFGLKRECGIHDHSSSNFSI
ncbi:phosphoadenosine phosphosulfate reductase [Verrucomicrobia bacterium LW23]|nr:phosphoadenosine phosphosulfate reductase [Verrucomicrobia bacterium LW23]